jgi:gamma-glutamyltranspeptidase/glutathione hydrolase
MSTYIHQFADNYRLWPQNAAIFLPNGRPPEVGELFVQQDLARSLQYMADQEQAARHQGREAGLAAARHAFYEGDLAMAMARFYRENGGWLTEQDLAEYRSEIEAPLSYDYKGTEVFSCGPWCQGPVLLQMLALLEGCDLKAMGHNSAAYVHCIAEAMKLCFADRHHLYGDPRFVNVPMQRLLSAEYAAERRKLIDPDRASPGMPAPGIPGAAFSASPRRPADDITLAGDTSYVCVVDRDGNAVSITPSDTSYESPIVPGLGFCPSSRGSQSWADPLHPSCVQPGKRPRLTPNPALARRRGEFVMPFGGPGGDLQPQSMLQVFLNHVEFGMQIQDAVEAARFVTHSFPHSFEPHAYNPGRLDLEQPIGEAAGAELAARGHDVQWRPALSPNTAGVCSIVANQSSGILYGGADPRRAARAMGW